MIICNIQVIIMQNKIQEQAVEIIEQKTSLLKRIFIILFMIAFVSGGIFFFHEYKNGKFSNLETFQEYINAYNVLGPFALATFQCFKVIYAFIPGTLGYVVGPTLFGTVTGIICNYIGICLGSFIAFWLSRKFGNRIIRQIFSKKRYERCMHWMNKKSKNFPLFLWLALLIPVSPDDFLCYFAGITDIKFSKFALIILTSKPWTIIVYGLIFGTIFNS